MKTLKQFAAVNFNGGIKTNTGNAAKQNAANILDAAAGAAKLGTLSRPDQTLITAARILRKGGYIGTGHGVLTAWCHL